MISDKQPVKDVIALLQAWEVKDIIITPGSRNAPFSLSFFRHPDFRTYSIVDERTAGFFALGLSQQTKIPTVLICTSGTAALNYAPAIAEAFYQRVPLIVITADRPIEWIDQGEGQSIRQNGVFQNYVRKSVTIVQEAEDKDLQWYNYRMLNEAIQEAFGEIPGPVHINFPLRENLYQTDRRLSSVKPYYTAKITKSIEEGEKKALRSALKGFQKIMLLVGQMPPQQALNKAVEAFAQNSQVAVFTETHANLSHPKFVTCIDRFLMSLSDQQKKELVPELLITFGHNIISRKIKALIRQARIIHWHIDESGEGLDTFQNLNRILPVSPLQFFQEIGEVNNASSQYGPNVNRLHEEAARWGNAFLASAPFSDLAAVAKVMEAIPTGSDVQMGNSSIVRYMQLYDQRNDLQFFGNRGVAGIDGCTSTALGAAWISKRATTFVSGDVAFLYDSNAFWHKYHSQNVRIVVVNNAGGGIFRIIDGPSGNNEVLEEFFETTHSRSAEGLANMYHLPYASAANAADLEKGLQWLYQQNAMAVLEIFTPRLENNAVLKAFFTSIKEHQNPIQL